MKRVRVQFTLMFLLVAVVVAGGGVLLFGSGHAKGVLAGATAAFVVQMGHLQLLLLQDRQQALVAHGVGMLIRFMAVGLMAFLIIPAMALPAAATLLSMVAYFFVTTLIEAVLPKRRQQAAQVADATTISD